MRLSVQQAIETASTAADAEPERRAKLTEAYQAALEDVSSLMGYTEETTGGEHENFYRIVNPTVEATVPKPNHVNLLDFDTGSAVLVLGVLSRRPELVSARESLPDPIKNFKFTYIRALNTLTLLRNQHPVGLVTESAKAPVGRKFLSMYKRSQKFKPDELRSIEQQLKEFADRKETPPAALRHRCEKMHSYGKTSGMFHDMIGTWTTLMQMEKRDYETNKAQVPPLLIYQSPMWDADPNKGASMLSFLTAFLICWPMSFIDSVRELFKKRLVDRFQNHLFLSWRHSAAYARWVELDKMLPPSLDGYAVNGALCNYVICTHFLLQALDFNEVRKLCADMHYLEAIDAAMAYSKDELQKNK